MAHGGAATGDENGLEKRYAAGCRERTQADFDVELRPEALTPMTECIFEGVIQNVNAYREEGLDSVPALSHLLLFVYPFRDDLVDRGFGESGRYSRSNTKPIAVVRHRIGIQFQITNRIQQRIAQFS